MARSRRNPEYNRPMPPSFSSFARTAAGVRPVRSAYFAISASMSSRETATFSRRATSSSTRAPRTASVAAVLLAAGAKGKRYSLPNSRILIHQPWVQGLGGQTTDIDIHARELLRTRERLNQILSDHTGQPLKRIQDDTERDYIMGADAGKEYGIIDDVIRKRA